MNSRDRMLIQRVAQGDVNFRYEPDPNKGHARLVGSTISQSQQKHLHRLAVEGYLAEHVGSYEPDPKHLPGTKVTYMITAVGRDAIGIRQESKRPQHRYLPLTEEQLYKEGIE